jgi:hypothetical protein
MMASDFQGKPFFTANLKNKGWSFAAFPLFFMITLWFHCSCPNLYTLPTAAHKEATDYAIIIALYF